VKVLTLATALSAAGPVLQESGIPVDAEAKALSGSDWLVVRWWIFKVCTDRPCPPDADRCCGSVGF
jgi:hypothetical protein